MVLNEILLRTLNLFLYLREVVLECPSIDAKRIICKPESTMLHTDKMNDFGAQSYLNTLYCSKYQSTKFFVKIVDTQGFLKITVLLKNVVAIGNFKCTEIVGYSEIANNFKFILGSSFIMKQ